MLKLYKLSKGGGQYWETWEESPGVHRVHWGELGTTGESKFVRSKLFSGAEAQLQKEIDTLVLTGFAPIAPEAHSILMIEYAVEGMATEADLEKRHALEDRMNETLGWSGLGACDGGSIGSGTMEVCNFVVDFDLARQVIESNLAGTEFGDYVRIFREELD